MSDDKPAVSRPLGVEDAIGLWQVSSGSGGKATCRIALDRFAQSGGYGVHVEACEIASFRGVRTWRPIENGFELVGPSGDVIAAFRRQGVDAFSAADGPYRLERAPLA